MEMNNAEIKVSIKDDLTDVYLNGTTENLVIAICAVIRSIAINLADNTDLSEIKATLDDMDVTREDLQEVFVPVILTHIIDSLDYISDVGTPKDNPNEEDNIDNNLTDIVKNSLLNFDIFGNDEENDESWIIQTLLQE